MPSPIASALVFVTSAAVLVLEILAARLLAPYVGVTLETYTAIIATVLAGIAGGTWLGGRASDRVDPRRLIGPLVAGGGGLALATVPLVRIFGPAASTGAGSVLVATAIAFLPPAAVLSAVTPAVVKLQLRDLGRTGEVVGRLSALGTAGAIAGTLVAGFVLVELAPTSTSIVVLGALLVAAGVALWVALHGRRTRGVVPLVVAAVLALGMNAALADPCDAETTYHCARIVHDPERAGGRLLLLDALRHSYVDVDDPRHLEFRYTQLFAEAVDALAPDGPLDAVHVGGGALTMPRWLAETRPGTTSVVLEIDGRLVELVGDRLGPVPPGTSVHVGDARILLRNVPDDSADVVFGDAFGGVAVPWHLTTEEAVADVARVLDDEGVYVLNVIDYPPFRFARAEAATLAAVFDNVAAVLPPGALEGTSGGNIVLVASDSAIDVDRFAARVRTRFPDDVVVTGAELRDFVGDAPVLRDDHAPVDQWLARAER